MTPDAVPRRELERDAPASLSGISPAPQESRRDPQARPWVAGYQPGVPAEIDAAAIPTLVQTFQGCARRYADRPALESFGTRISFAELAREAAAMASWLQQQGLDKGDRVALMMPNVMAYAPVLFGTLLAGGIVVNVNPLYTPRELDHQLRDSGAKFLFVLENFAHTVAACASAPALQRVVLVAPGDGLGLKGHVVNFVSRRLRRSVPPFSLPAAIRFGDARAAGTQAPPRDVPLSPDDPAFLQYTGGTTGIAKGATLTHRQIGSNLAQLEAWVAPSFAGAADHVMMTALPLYHIFALTVCALLMLKLGGCQILIVNPRDIPGLVKVMRRRRFTLFAGVNTLYAALAADPGLARVDFSRVRLCAAGGMATQESVARRWKAITGKAIVEGYGLSETSPLVCSNRVDIAEFSGSVGYPVPSTEIALRDAAGADVPPGEPGELCVRGPQLMAGYWQRADETAKAMTADGYFRTGDVAVLQADGQVRIVDRVKDMIIVSGFNVYPNEVEAVLAGHPGIREAAVVGVPDDHFGESVTAIVVRADPALDEAEIKAWCRQSLTPYKVPRRVLFRDSLPKTPVGKVLRRAIRESLTGAG